MKPRSMPKASSSTLAIGTTELVVQDALEMMSWLAGSYLESLTPITMVTSSPLAGAEMITLRAPALRCRAALSRSVKRPVDSITMSTPRSPQLSCDGSRSAEARIGLPSTLIEDSSKLTSPSSTPKVESYFSRCARVRLSVRSLTATTSTSPLPRPAASRAARYKLRPMRPKPLIPTRTIMRPPVAGDIRACGVRDPDAGTGKSHGHCSARHRGSSRGRPHPLQRGFPAGLPVVLGVLAQLLEPAQASQDRALGARWVQQRAQLRQARLGIGQAQRGDVGDVGGQALPAELGDGRLDHRHLRHRRGHAAAEVRLVGVGEPHRLAADLAADAAVLPGEVGAA